VYAVYSSKLQIGILEVRPLWIDWVYRLAQRNWNYQGKVKFSRKIVMAFGLYQRDVLILAGLVF